MGIWFIELHGFKVISILRYIFLMAWYIFLFARKPEKFVPILSNYHYLDDHQYINHHYLYQSSK